MFLKKILKDFPEAPAAFRAAITSTVSRLCSLRVAPILHGIFFYFKRREGRREEATYIYEHACVYRGTRTLFRN